MHYKVTETKDEGYYIRVTLCNIFAKMQSYSDVTVKNVFWLIIFYQLTHVSCKKSTSPHLVNYEKAISNKSK